MERASLLHFGNYSNVKKKQDKFRIHYSIQRVNLLLFFLNMNNAPINKIINDK